MGVKHLNILIRFSSILLQKAILMLLYDYFSSYETIVVIDEDELYRLAGQNHHHIIFTDCESCFSLSRLPRHSHVVCFGSHTTSLSTNCHTFIHINTPEESIVETLKTVFSRFHSTSSQDNDDTLSEREKEILALIATGHSNKEIAGKLFISPHTVITHRKNITAKLNIKTISGLTLYALLNGLVNLQGDHLK